MKKHSCLLATLLAVAGFNQIASAVPTLYVSTSGAAGTWTAVATGVDGAVSFSGTVGVWDFVFAGGLDMPTLGSAGAPAMDLTISSGSTSGAGALWIAFADTGFTDASGGINATITGQVTSGAAETYQFTTFASASDNQPTTTLPTGSDMTTLSGSLPIDASTTGMLPGTEPDTLGIVLELYASGVSSTSVDASFSATPDGGSTVLLLGGALCGFGLIKRRFFA